MTETWPQHKNDDSRPTVGVGRTDSVPDSCPEAEVRTLPRY